MSLKSSSSSDLPVDERVVHYALEELSERGSDSDSQLVNSILLSTVDRKPSSPAQSPSLSIGNWLVGVGAVAALLLLLIGVLSSLPYTRDDRNHSEIQFVVSVTPPELRGNPENTALSLEGSPYRGAVDVVIAASPSLPGSSTINSVSQATRAEWTYPLPVAIASDESVHREEKVEIDSDSVSRESEHLVYSGNVQLKYRSFLISADEIRLLTEPTASNSAFLTAENAVFSSEKEADFPVIAATAGQLEIDPVTGLIRLEKVGLLETLENGRISIVDSQSVSISEAGYAIENRLRR